MKPEILEPVMRGYRGPLSFSTVTWELFQESHVSCKVSCEVTYRKNNHWQASLTKGIEHAVIFV